MHTFPFHPADSASRYGRLMRACCESLEGRRLFAVVTEGDLFGSVNGQNLVLQQTDIIDGDTTKYSLTGGGTGQITDGAITLVGTTQNSVLKITVKKATGGDGLVLLTGIQADHSLKSIQGTPVILAGDILLNTPNDPFVEPTGQVAITLNSVRDGSINTGGEPISSLTLLNWGAATSEDITQEIQAPWIGTLSVKGRKASGSNEAIAGNMAATLNLSGAASNGQSLKSATIKGAVTDINAAGAIGSLTAGRIDGAITATTISTVTTKVGQSELGLDGSAAGSIRATGTPTNASKPAINTVKIGGSALGLTITTDTGNIGTVTVNGAADNLQILSAGTANTLRVVGAFANSRIQTQGNVSQVNVGAMLDSNVLVGFAPTFDGTFATSSADFANGIDTTAKLNKITVGKSQRGQAVALVAGSNNISAAQLGSLTFFTLQSVDPPSLLVQVLPDPSGKSPGSVKYVDNIDPANNFTWKAGQSQPALLQAMLTVVP